MDTLIARARVLLAILWTGVWAIPFLPAFVLLLPSRRARVIVSAWYGRVIAAGALRIFGVRVDCEGLEHVAGSEPRILLLNHASNLDPFLALWTNPIGGVGVAKRQIVMIPVFGQMYLLSGHLLIDRAKPDQAVAALRGVADVVHRLKLGLCLWPEGTQPHDGRLLPFKKGFAHFALATKLPVVCGVVHGAHKVWPARTLDVRPGTVRITFLPPIDTSDWREETLDAHVAMVRGRFIEALGPDQRPLDAA